VQHHYEGHWKGWALKIETFLGPEMARTKIFVFLSYSCSILIIQEVCVVYCILDILWKAWYEGSEISLENESCGEEAS
jgi:hypothetical protein